MPARGQQLTAERGRHLDTWRIARALNTFHQLRVLRHDWLDVRRRAAFAAEHLTDPDTHVLARQYPGLAHASLGHADEGVRLLLEALALAERHADRGNIHRSLARAWEQQGDDVRALEHATSALRSFRSVGDPAWTAVALNAVGWYSAKVGRYDEAGDRCREALALHRDLDSPAEKANTLNSLGYVEHHVGRHEEAVAHYREALALYDELGYRLGGVDTLEAVGHPHLALGQVERARASWGEALELYRRQGPDTDAVRVRRHLDDLG